MTGTSAPDVIRPGDGRYSGVRHVYAATGSPAAVVVPRSAGEVAKALDFVLEAGAPFSVRSGGHGISTNDGGTVIDLGSLDAVERSGSDGRTVRIGPGASWGHVARKLHPWGLAISSGDSGDVGVGGLATAGGIGLMGRAHGLTIDHLVSADVVTADGRMRRVDADHEPDLFWAVRGAGAYVGIVTSFEFRADPVPVVARATVLYEAGGIARFFRDWGATVERAPREVSAFLYLFGGEPAGRTMAQATIVFAGDDTDAAARLLEPFLRFAPVVGQRAEMTPYATVVTPTNAPHVRPLLDPAPLQRGRRHNGRRRPGLPGRAALPVDRAARRPRARERRGRLCLCPVRWRPRRAAKPLRRGGRPGGPKSRRQLASTRQERTRKR